MQTPISIILADAHYLVRVGLKHLLAGRPEFRIVDEAEDHQKLTSILKTKKPDVIIIDPFQADKFSIETVQAVQQILPECGLLIISADQKRSTVYKALERNINCFLTKECDDREIFEAIEAAAQNERFFCKKILNYIWEKSFGKGDDCSGTPLSGREVEILKLVANGKITKEIAFELKLSMHTVYTHRKNILRKLNLNSTPELVLYAVNQGIVESDRIQYSN